MSWSRIFDSVRWHHWKLFTKARNRIGPLHNFSIRCRVIFRSDSVGWSVGWRVGEMSIGPLPCLPAQARDERNSARGCLYFLSCYSFVFHGVWTHSAAARAFINSRQLAHWSDWLYSECFCVLDRAQSARSQSASAAEEAFDGRRCISRYFRPQ